MSNFKIHDNFFPPEEIKTINEYITRPRWSFNGGGTYLENDNFKSHFWHMNGLEKEEYFTKTLWEFIRRQCFGYDESYRNSEPPYKNVELIRCYANGQTAGQHGVPHKDDGDVTVLYYPNQWQHYWGGHLHLMKDNMVDYIIEYKHNRLVMFDANVEHYSTAPVLSYGGLRMSVAWKVKIHKEGENNGRN